VLPRHITARRRRPRTDRQHLAAPQPCAHRESGQAAVELVALFPLLIALAALAWQLAIAGHALWAATAAARVAARANAIGLDAGAAARSRLPGTLARGARIRAEDDGTVEVSVRIPAVLGLLELGDATGRAHFEPQR
jgi:hypothetical protein